MASMAPEAFALLSPPLKGLLQETGISTPTPPQVEAIPLIAQGDNVLIIAPTGSGKTEAALLPLIDRMIRNNDRQGISLVYITPLRALNRDLLKRLQTWSNKLGFSVEIRHGDTPAKDRRRMAVKPPDLLITTPETLQAILPGKRMREHLRHVKSVIVDEIHELAGDRRGVQMTVGLERLREICVNGYQRVGLSATVGNPEEIALFLGGNQPVKIVQIPLNKPTKYKVEYPLPGEEDRELAQRLYTTPEAAARLTLVDDLVEAHDSTLIFVNSRVNAELLGSKFNMMDRKIMVHHGSLPKEERVRAEEAFKAREIKGLVCIPEDEMIVTTRGVRHGREITVGDSVLSYDLDSCKTVFRPVMRKYRNTTDRLMHVRHELGLLRVTPNHPVLCLGADGFAWKTAGQLVVGDALVTIGRMQGPPIPTYALIDYPNLFVKNPTISSLGYDPSGNPDSEVSRLSLVKLVMSHDDLLKVNDFSTTQTRYTFPSWVDLRLGYLLGFRKSDGDKYMRFFNTDSKKLGQVESYLSDFYKGSMYRAVIRESGSSFRGNKPRMVLQAHSKPLSNVLDNLWKTLPLPFDIVSSFLAGYLDGDGCAVVRNYNRLEQLQFVTFDPVNREYLIFLLLSLGMKPKLRKANGASGEGFTVSVVYSDDKSRLLELVREQSIKARELNAPYLGRKQRTFYGLGPYIKFKRIERKISSYTLWKLIGYSTKYENPKRGIGVDSLSRLNGLLKSPLLDGLIEGKFGISQVRSVKNVEGKVDVVNFEVEHTQTYAVGGVVTHNCTSTLELGIDIGSVDLVIQYMSPRQVSSLVQRVGRSGHTLTRTSQGVLVSVSTEDLLESVGVIELAKEGRLEHTNIHIGALDVLAHQIAGVLMDSEGSLELSQAKSIIKRAYPYRDLEDDPLDKVIEFMHKMGYLKREKDTLYRTSRTRLYYFENLSMIPDERRYLVVDLTNLQNVGFLGEEFMITKARIGLNFIVKGRVWQIKQITDDAKVYVLPINDPTAAIPGWDGQILPVPRALATKVGAYRAIVERNIAQHAPKSISVERLSQLWPADVYGLKRVVEEIEAHKATGAAVPTDQRVLIEGFDRYIILHTHLGDIVNFTLGEVIEELFRRQGIVRMWWSDAYRILFEMNADTSDLELEELFREQIFGVEETVLGGACHGVLHRHFPWQLHMKHIAERFGALNRGRLMYGDAMKELMLRYRLTPIYDETIREALMEHSDFDAVKEIFLRIKKGSMEVQFFQSKERPTPLAYHIIYRHVDVPELIAPENVAADNLARLRISIEGRVTDMLCFDCGILNPEILIADLPDHPQCTSCGSRLLAPLFWSSHYAADIVKKKRNRENLDENEQKVLARARRSADLVISYGRRAVIAQSVYGIGPQTASRILATMRDREEEFYQDLLDAKLHFIATRPYWNN
ncbi:DEAD/DEAH box helicase [Candidatus Bathyarchaeota archaeon]|nr:MAG: DEAD/DEAH box helicase [Candidatus Bathyarchaeota archaeon]